MNRMRLQLVLFSFCWLFVSLANFEVSEFLRWHPDLVGGLALATAVLTFVLALVPTFTFAYRTGGTFAIGTIGFRTASICLGYARADPGDVAWFSVTTAAMSLMLGFLYWSWWLREVKGWHEAHRDIRGLANDSG